jgi:hypothetical protein
MVALSGTLLVVYQICAAERDIFFSLEVMLASFQKEVIFSTRSSLISFHILYFIFCVFCELMI